MSGLPDSHGETEQGNVSQQILAAKAGSTETLGQLLDACRGYLLLIANAELDPGLRGKGGASDLVQETFLEAQQKFIKFRGESQGELLAWLRQILLSHLANFARSYRQTHKRQITSEVPLGVSNNGSRLGSNSLKHRELSPSWCAISREETEILESVLEKLDQDERTIILLVHREHLTFTEAGRRMNRSADSARRLWSRAVERLAREVEETHGLR